MSGRGTNRPSGVVTRGTTNPNRLRRVDRWLAATYGPLLRGASAPLVVDLGFGASPVTTTEMYARLRAIRPDVDVLGLEIAPERVAAARAAAGHLPGLSFALGGFEVPAPRPPVVVRAFNVLRQYDEADVAAAWSRVCARLAPGGVLIEGTCDEPGRLATWTTLGADGVPRTLTLAARLATLERPARFAERLPKALIHRNVPGERVHAVLSALDRAWEVSAPAGAFGVRQRWCAAVGLLARDFPVADRPSRWRLGEVTLPWAVVAP